jgi:glycerol-1-phosphate dehydrogenase [NAD(P)+]
MDITIRIGHETVPELLCFCKQQERRRFTLVADRNTYAVLGCQVEAALRRHGLHVTSVVLADEAVVPDERSIMRVLVGAGRESGTFLAVGSGTLTDITRFASHRSRTDFISLPTAPSVDGYTAPGASLVLDRLKQTVPAHPPIAIFADLPTLCAAPRPMIAAGFGDVLGKFTALADWRLAHVLVGERYGDAVARRVQEALDACIRHVDAIGNASGDGIRVLMSALIETGACMLDFGASRPAAGAEHYASHYLEMMLLWSNRPAILHGAKVGLATLRVAEAYGRLRDLTRERAIDSLREARRPDRAGEVERIRAAYGGISEHIVAEQSAWLGISEDDFEAFKATILTHWTEVQRIAAAVPAPDTLAQWLRSVGGGTDAAAIGLTEADMAAALDASPYLRDRFTILRLNRLLGI